MHFLAPKGSNTNTKFPDPYLIISEEHVYKAYTRQSHVHIKRPRVMDISYSHTFDNLFSFQMVNKYIFLKI